MQVAAGLLHDVPDLRRATGIALEGGCGDLISSLCLHVHAGATLLRCCSVSPPTRSLGRSSCTVRYDFLGGCLHIVGVAVTPDEEMT